MNLTIENIPYIFSSIWREENNFQFPKLTFIYSINVYHMYLNLSLNSPKNELADKKDTKPQNFFTVKK